MEISTADINNLPTVEWNDEIIMTTAQIAEFYGCKPRRIYDNFRNNRDRFVEGKHFFKLEGDDLAAFKRYIENLQAENFGVQPENLDDDNENFGVTAKKTLYLWTKRGAARHAKMLTTDKAWDVFELLEDCYFNRVNYQNTLPGAPFWWELQPKNRKKQPTDFERGVALRKLASHTRNPELRESLIAQAALLIANSK